MDDEEFLRRVRAKIERLAGTEIHLEIDAADESRMSVDLGASVPRVMVGSSVLQYSGFARMAIEYAVASIRERRELGRLEFRALLGRN